MRSQIYVRYQIYDQRVLEMILCHFLLFARIFGCIYCWPTTLMNDDGLILLPAFLANMHLAAACFSVDLNNEMVL